MVVDILKIVSQLSGLTILIFISLLLQDLYLSKNKLHPRILGEKTPEIFIGRLQDSWGFSQAVAWRLESSNQQNYTVSKVLKVYFIKVFQIKIFSFQGNPKDWVVWYQLELNLFSFWSKDFQIHFACGLNYQKLYLHTFI